MDKPTKVKRKLREERRRNHHHRTKRVMSMLGNLTGFRTEQRFFEAFEDFSDLPSWLHAIQRANKRMDRRGVDAIAITDHGHFYIQIKSSEHRALAFKSKHQNDQIGIVVPLKSDTPEYIRYQTLSFLEPAYLERVEHKRQQRREKRKRQRANKKSRNQGGDIQQYFPVIENSSNYIN